MIDISFLTQYVSQGFWQYVWAGNTLGEYAIAGAVLILGLIVLKYVQWFILRILKKGAQHTKTDIDDTLVEIIGSIKPPFYSFLALYVAVRTLALSDIVARIFTVVLIVWIAYQVVLALQILIDYVLKKKFDSESDAGAQGAVLFMSGLFKGVLWGIALIMVLGNLGVDVTSLIAGLGIGGIAIAFALQNILSDLFSSFVIHFDKPFVIGDFIIVGEHMGTVERIGIKTTRIRALQGEEIVISNQELTSARVQNFKKMEERRIVFHLGVTYDTDPKVMEQIPDMVKSAIDPIEGTRFDRCHFQTFADSALVFETVYYVASGDYAQYMDIQQNINMDILKSFNDEGIDFAFPTQTIHIEK
jgi:small-conductance mechanosensitive channel